MAITRIQNNQITDNTIQANAKVTPGSITGNLFASSVTLNSNITILGNLTVSNNYTQLNSVNTYIGDPLVVYNNGYVGTPSYDVGMLVNRNLYSTAPYGSVNAAFVWKEADTAFEAIMTTETGTTAGAINNSGYANVKLGNLTAVSTTITGGFNVTGAVELAGAVQVNNTLGVTGITSLTNTTNTSAPTNGALVVSGGVGIGKDVQTGGNVYIAGTNQTTGINTGALQVTNGGAYIAGNLWVGGNINFTPGSVNTITGNSAQFFGNAAGFGALYAGINSGFTYQAQTTLQVSSNFDGYAQINSQNINAGPLASSDYIATADNGNASDTYIDMGIASSNYNYPGFDLIHPNDGYLLVYGNATTGGGNLLISTSTNNDIVFATNGFAHSNEFGRITDLSTFVVKSTVASTTTTSGAIQVAGGVGVQGAIYAGSLQNTPIGSTTPNTGAFTTVTTTGTVISNGNIVAASGTSSTTTASGALVVVGGAGISEDLNVGGIAKISNSTESSSITNGALIVSGGVGITRNLNVGGSAVIAGNLTVNGEFQYINSTVTTHEDPILELNTGANGAALGSSNNADAGIRTHYYASGADKTAFFGRTNNTGFFEYYSAVTSEVGNVIAGTYGTVKSGEMLLANSTASTSTTSGALRVTGGAGIGGALYVGGEFVNSGNIVAASGTGSTSTTTGALVVTGGVGVSGNITLGGDAVIAGDAYIAGGDVWTSASTFNLVNTTATTVNAFGAATTLNTGNASGVTNMSGVVKVGGNLVATSGTASTNTTTGALVVTGGVGVSGQVYAGGIQNTPIGSTTPNTGAFTTVTTTGTMIADGNIVAASGTASTNTTTGALVVTGGVGVSGAMYVGGTTVSQGNIVAGSGTNTTSTTTGAMTVVGGAGISGNLFVGGGVTLNSDKSANYDVTIAGNNDDTLFWARSGNAYDQIVIGNSATTSTLVTGAKVIINTSDAIIVPAGTNAQRPSNAGGTDAAGMVRFNTTSANLEYYNGTGWMNAGTTFTIIQDDQITANGSASYTVGGQVSTNGALVSINGVIQIPTLAYSITGTTITFTEPVQAGEIIDIRRMSTTQQVTEIASSNGYMTFSTGNDGAKITTGTNSSNAIVTTYWDTTGGQVSAIANVIISSSGVASGIDSFSAASYRSAKYIVQVTNGSNFETKEVLLVQNGTNAYISQYGTVNTGTSLGVITASVNAGVVTLYYNANNANTTIRLRKEYVAI